MLDFRRMGAGNVARLTLALLLPVIIGGGAAVAEESHAIAMHGTPAIRAGFTHLPYFNPDPPKGGRLIWGILGTFDSLNPLIVRGLPVQQVRPYNFERGYVIESLMARGENEPFTLYGLLAKSVETDEDRTYVTFHL